MNRNTQDSEEYYATSLNEPLAEAGDIGEVDIVVGLSFRNEFDTIGHVCETLVRGLVQFFPEKRCVLVCVGGKEGEEALQAVRQVRMKRNIRSIAFLMKDELVSGKVWTVRAIMEVASRLHADLALFEADLKSRDVKGDIEGLAPEWVRRLLFPDKQRGCGPCYSEVQQSLPRYAGLKSLNSPFTRFHFQSQSSGLTRLNTGDLKQVSERLSRRIRYMEQSRR